MKDSRCQDAEFPSQPLGQVGWAVATTHELTLPPLLPQHDGLLDGDLAGSINHIGPAVPEMPQSFELASVVSPHIAPLLGGAVMSESAVELDVYAVRLEQYVEVLDTLSAPGRLAST